MSKMKAKKRNKVGLLSRRKSALERLEKSYNVFISAKSDKISKNKTVPFEKEVYRMENEITRLKYLISLGLGK